jgi:hypothetical protein
MTILLRVSIFITTIAFLFVLLIARSEGPPRRVLDANANWSIPK